MELTELRNLLDDPKNRGRHATGEDDIRQALQALMMHQVVYRDWPLSGGPFNTVHRHRSFFDRYVSAMGAELVFEHRLGMIAMRPATTQYGWKQTRLKKDETLVLLALRYLYDEGMANSQMTEDGRIETTTDHVHDLISTGVGETPPDESRLMEILHGFHRKGLVRLGKRDSVERLTPLTVLPGVRVIVSDVYVQAVADWIDQGAPEDTDGFFQHVTRRVAGNQTGDDETGDDETGGDGAADAEAEADAGTAPVCDDTATGPDETADPAVEPGTDTAPSVDADASGQQTGQAPN
ncbi:DUF4194 domain-containing protein [Rhodovibrio salinarum]|uniref:DUF4194 domain-containing protein n=1 Tax=Rhodovibrio salinarum TaxID=1087 RepID=A0A934QKR4_9PROT|nr:DUF4194 domain-containing protein [Rhodovibrio salinarum]MBK1698295.1 DUF4194 domain-containing protein [Rhodovibrio salinarum]